MSTKVKITKQINVAPCAETKCREVLVEHRPKFKALIYFSGKTKAIQFGWAQRTSNFGAHTWMVFNLDGKPILETCSFYRDTAIERASYVAVFGKELGEAA